MKNMCISKSRKKREEVKFTEKRNVEKWSRDGGGTII